MQPDLTIRKASRDDLPSLQKLYRQLDRDGLQPDTERLRKTFDLVDLHPSYEVHLAFDGGVAVGTFALLIMPALGSRCTPAGVVEDVVVDRNARGRGVGRRMMEHAMMLCRRAGCYKMVLSSNVNRNDAHHFYEALGFERHGYSFRVELTGESGDSVDAPPA